MTAVTMCSDFGAQENQVQKNQFIYIYIYRVHFAVPLKLAQQINYVSIKTEKHNNWDHGLHISL